MKREVSWCGVDDWAVEKMLGAYMGRGLVSGCGWKRDVWRRWALGGDVGLGALLLLSWECGVSTLVFERWVRELIELSGWCSIIESECVDRQLMMGAGNMVDDSMGEVMLLTMMGRGEP